MLEWLAVWLGTGHETFKAAQCAFRLETGWHGLCIPWWRSMWTCVMFDSIRKRKGARRHWAAGRMLRRGPTSIPSLPPPPSGDHIQWRQKEMSFTVWGHFSTESFQIKCYHTLH
ncbi:hypothetical protein DFH09DRAFT_1098364 [Mycena vulgaris]|nr:hypothetical protein DFH09DRAFT_1098364 [Mycena vulgaris]